MGIDKIVKTYYWLKYSDPFKRKGGRLNVKAIIM